MKRVLPLLSRVAPMLETYVAARGATRQDDEAIKSLAADLHAHLNSAARSQADLRDTLESQNAQLRQISSELERLDTATASHSARIDFLDQQLASGMRAVRMFAIAIVGLLLVCAVLLVVLLLRR